MLMLINEEFYGLLKQHFGMLLKVHNALYVFQKSVKFVKSSKRSLESKGDLAFERCFVFWSLCLFVFYGLSKDSQRHLKVLHILLMQIWKFSTFCNFSDGEYLKNK